MRALGLALVLLLASCSVDRPSPDAAGVEIYRQLCANCHGADLSGGIGPALGPGSDSASRPDEFLLVTIEQGRGRMPSFATSLDDQQLERLVGYIRQEQQG
jgi:mono/diheme cytochrome c family protein